MRLQKQVNRIVEDKEYSKYVVVIPPESIGQLGWIEGQELDSKIDDNKLVIYSKNESTGRKKREKRG